MRFRQRQRIKRTAEFEAMRVDNAYAHTAYFVINFKLTEAEDTPPLRRVGVVASRRVGPAVDRNYAKRRLREVFRLNQALLPPSCTLVLIAKKGILHASFAEIEEAFRQSATKCTRHYQRKMDQAAKNKEGALDGKG